MKVLLLILSFFLTNLYSAIWIEETVGSITHSDKVALPDGSTYTILKGVGAGKDNTGKYSSGVCIGHRLEKNNALIELKVYCDMELSNGNKYYYTQLRANSDTDAGVGKVTILGGTGVFSKLIGTQCLYGIKHTKKNVYSTTKCEIPDNIFNQLKNDN